MATRKGTGEAGRGSATGSSSRLGSSPTRQADATTTSFLDVLESPDLMGPWFSEPSWDRWKTFARSCFGLPAEQGDVETFAHFTERTTWPIEQAREAWAIVGRRGGKSLFMAALATYLAAFRSYAQYLKPGQRAYVLVMASDRDQAAEVMGYITGFFDNIGALAGLVEQPKGGAKSAYREVLRLKNRVVIRVQVASFRRIRGKTVVAAVCDEIAFWYDNEESANPAAEVLKAVRPSMLTIPGALLIGITSPYARRGVVWETYTQHYRKDGDRVLVWKAPTTAMNSSVDLAEIDRAYEDDPDSARAEYGAEFRQDLESFVSPEAVAAVTMLGRLYLPFERHFRHFAFVDPAGGSGQDSMSLAIVRHDHGRAVVCRVAEWKPPFSPETATAEAAAILKEYGLARATGDHYAGDWPAERFKAHGITYVRADHAKSDYYQALLPLVNGRRVELLDHKKALGQLLSLEKSTGRSGKDSISHPPNGHDDLINAVAGAAVMALRKKMLEGHAPSVPLKRTPEAEIREEVVTMGGVDVVMRIYPDGTERVDRIADGAAVERLSHSFPNCETCGGQHMSTDGEPVTCPRIGWVGGPAGIPVYPGPPRTLDIQEQEASGFNRSMSAGLNQLAREIERRTGEKV
jgi:hypothetical protein